MARPEADASIMEASGLANQRHPDDNLAVRFTLEPVENQEKSKEQGRPIFDDTEIIEIRIPGDPDIRRHAVSAEDKQRFHRQYAAWKANQDQHAVTGTPLSAWPLIKRSQVEEAKFFGVHTVEQLSEVADVNLQRLGPGWITLRAQALDWLKKAKDGAMLAKLRHELEERDRRIDALERMLKAQADELHKAPSQQPTLSVVQPANAEVEALKSQMAQLMSMMPKQGSVSTTLPVVIEIPKKKRGRPSKAELAAREAAKNGE
jgi:hypothetical protein